MNVSDPVVYPRNNTATANVIHVTNYVMNSEGAAQKAQATQLTTCVRVITPQSGLETRQT
jgi:hypothetical protein